MRFLKLILPVFLAMAAMNSLADAAAINNNPYDGSQTLTGYVPKDVATSTFQRHAKTSEVFPMRVIMPLKPGLPALIDQLYNPKSKIYRHFLTPKQIADQFGTSTIDSDRVKNFLVGRGFTILSQSNDRTVFRVLAPAAAIKNAFNVGIDYYKKTDGTTFRTPDGDPKIPVEVADKITGLLGLDDLKKFQSHIHQSPIHSKTAAKPQIGTALGGGILSPSDITKAYNLNAIKVPANAPGQTVALFEAEGYSPTDMDVFLKYFNLPYNNNMDNPCNYTSSTPDVPVDFNSPPNSSCSSNVLQNVLIDGYNGGDRSASGEAPADIEMLLEINPNLSKIYVYENSGGDLGWEDAWQQIETDNAAKIISVSWGQVEQFSNDINSDDIIFQEMAAQGQDVFAASGDCGAYGEYGDIHQNGCKNLNLLALNEPAPQPYATAVGISVLTVNTDGTFKGESASLQSGGGISYYQSIPSYQQGMISTASLGSTSMRNVPDLAFTADATTPFATYINGAWYGSSGSSLAAPVWASFVSLINQGRAAVNQEPIGFVNPVLYQIAQSPSYANDFHDMTTGSNNYGVVVNGAPSPYYPAVAGYDDATGLGSFNGANLYNDLVPPSAPTGLNAIPNNAQVTLSWTAPTGADSYNILRATSLSGLYTTIATALTKTSYTDTSVTNGTTYYYEVAASNFGGISLSSTPISSTPAGQSFTITANAGTGGNISPSGNVSIAYGASQVFTVTADAGYAINQVMVDNKAMALSKEHIIGGINTIHRVIKAPVMLKVYTFTLNDIEAPHIVFASFIQL